MLIILADLFVAVTAIVGANEYFCLKRYKSFTIPYTDKMISLGIIDAEKRESILNEDKISHYIGIALTVLCAGMLSKFIAQLSGVIVFILVFAGLLVFLHPDMEETAATRNGYFKSHRTIMDIRKYHDYLVSIGDTDNSDQPI